MDLAGSGGGADAPEGALLAGGFPYKKSKFSYVWQGLLAALPLAPLATLQRAKAVPPPPFEDRGERFLGNGLTWKKEEMSALSVSSQLSLFNFFLLPFSQGKPPIMFFSKLCKGFFGRETKSVMRLVGCVCVVYPLIQVILTVIKLLRLCLPHELHVDLRVKLPTLGQLQLKHTHTHTQSEYTSPHYTYPIIISYAAVTVYLAISNQLHFNCFAGVVLLFGCSWVVGTDQ